MNMNEFLPVHCISIRAPPPSFNHLLKYNQTNTYVFYNDVPVYCVTHHSFSILVILTRL